MLITSLSFYGGAVVFRPLCIYAVICSGSDVRVAYLSDPYMLRMSCIDFDFLLCL